MMLTFLQIWGGTFYLLNKIFFSRAERTEEKKWQVWAWVVYLIGLPAIVLMLGIKHNWIFASLELAGAPSMMLGLINSLRGKKGKDPEWLNDFAAWVMFAGFCYSIFYFGGMKTLTQWLEVGAVIGYLWGTFLRAQNKAPHKRAAGYLWYILMHLSTGTLMWIQNLPWFALQQAVSLLFVVDAYLTWKRKNPYPQQ